MRRFGGLLVLVFATLLSAEETSTVRVEHHFYWRKYIAQKYQGAVYGYQSGVWKLFPGDMAGTTRVEARYWLVSQSLRDLTAFEKPVDSERSASFVLNDRGEMGKVSGAGVPYYRNYPASPPKDAGVGSVWIGNGELVSDFANTGISTRIPILIEYRYDKLGDYFGKPVIQVKAQYALRYRQGQDPQGDPTLRKAEGSHVAMISYDVETLRPVYLTETIKELFSTTGSEFSHEGRIWTTFEGVPALEKSEVTETLTQKLSAASIVDVKVEPTELGVKLTLENLQFVADKAELLPGEDARLAVIANMLSKVPDRKFLVIGHTADVGTQESQIALSWDRALTIVAQLKRQGVEARRLLYEGRGGVEPVGSNATPEGRALNRRVEIIVLDQ